MLLEMLVLSAAAQAVDAGPLPGEMLYDVQHGPAVSRHGRPSVEVNETSVGLEDVHFLSAIGLPTVSRYRTPVLRYHESNGLARDGSSKELLVQIALSGDGSRMQVLVIQAARRSPVQVDIVDRQVVYVSPGAFASAVTDSVSASSKITGYDPTYIPVCSHNPQARFHAAVPGEIQIVRGGRCQGSSNAAVEAGEVLIKTAKTVLARPIRRAASF
jgi:hypothetical protein